MGKTVGWILMFGFVVFGVMGLNESSAYRPDVLPQFYFGAAFSCLVFGALCYEVGKCAGFLEKLAHSSKMGAPKSTPEDSRQGLASESVLEPSNDTIPCKKCGKIVPFSDERCPHCLWILDK